MANELLDFVMSLVRDPDAAAHYAANPAQALADAHLTGVTSADVNNLLPMVSDSLSMGAPATDAATAGDGNVWTSGAATAAFDAFTPHDTATAHSWSGVIDAPHTAVADSAGVTLDSSDLDPFAGYDASSQFSTDASTDSGATDGGVGTDDPAVWADWHHPVADAHDVDGGHPGFDHGQPGF